MANVTGLITVNSKEILEVDADPSAGAGTPASIASLAMYDNGAAGFLYIKTGAADTAWTLVDSSANDWSLAGNTLTGGGPTTPNEYFGSNNDYDVRFLRNSIEQMRLVNGALLVGLSATIGGRLQIGQTVANTDMMAEVFNAGANQILKVSRMNRLTTVGAATATNSIAIPNDYNALVTSSACVRQTGGATGAAGDGASYIRTLHARNIAGAVTVFQQQSDYTYEVNGGLNYSGAASGANVDFTASGVANRNLTWGIYTELLITGT